MPVGWHIMQVIVREVQVLWQMKVIVREMPVLWQMKICQEKMPVNWQMSVIILYESLCVKIDKWV